MKATIPSTCESANGPVVAIEGNRDFILKAKTGRLLVDNQGVREVHLFGFIEAKDLDLVGPFWEGLGCVVQNPGTRLEILGQLRVRAGAEECGFDEFPDKAAPAGKG